MLCPHQSGFAATVARPQPLHGQAGGTQLEHLAGALAAVPGWVKAKL
jgi:hypothetical protein